MYEIGEYIDLKQCQNSIVSKKEQNGYGDQYFTQEEVRFRVLYKDEERKKLVCIADKPTEQKICLKGEVGYKNGIEEIHRICKEISGYEEARSLTLEDIEKSKYLEYKDDTKSNMIFGKNDEFENWVANQQIRYRSSIANFNLFYVSGGTVDANYLYNSDYYYSSNSYAVRPVVEIDF
mgnify:CR=1 FL=1